jgi:hypothetical protein
MSDPANLDDHQHDQHLHDQVPQDQVQRGELVDRETVADDAEVPHESVQEPAKVMRVGSMIKQLLEEVRGIELDEPARDRLREIYDHSVSELSSALSPDLQEELSRLALPFVGDETPSRAELVVAKAQLVGWLEGLFHGIQATLFAQQMAARQQLEEMRHQLNPGSPGGPGYPGGGSPAQGQPPADRHGTYL